MTPSASASPVVLLNPVVEPGSSAAPKDSASPSPAGGGFQLLIDAATQQQVAPTLASLLMKNQIGTSTSTIDEVNKPSDTGNVLPLLGLLLPTDPAQVVGAKQASDKTKDGSKDVSPGDAKVADNTAIQLLWVPINMQAPPAAPSASIGAADTTLSAQPSDSGGSAAIAQLSTSQLPGNESQGIKLDTGSADGATLTPQADLTQGKQLPAARNTGANSEVLAAAPSSDAKIDAATTGLASATQKLSESASFADLLKPASTAQSSPAAISSMLDAGRPSQAARPYADINSTAATVSIPVGSSGWTDAVVDKVMWFSAHQFSSAEIQLNPPDLGPLQVRISTQHDQASIVFSSPHAAVRDALDQALPRLRDMLGGQGIQLSDASVGGQGAQRQQQQGGDQRSPSQGFFRNQEDGDATPVAVTRIIGPRLSTSAVDAYV